MSHHRRKHEDTESRGQRTEHREEAPDLYSIFRGEVASIQAYGAFVKIPGYRKNGLVHKSQISSARVEDVSEVLAVGDHVFCKVISHGEDDNLKISLSMKVVDQRNGKDLDANLVQTKKHEDTESRGQRMEHREEAPDLYSIFRGEVASIQAYGAFVKIPGYRKNGLVHITQISSTRVEDVSEVLAVGDHVFCKVISHGEDDNLKISLSMKMVDQGNGKDLDANLVQTKQEEQRRKKGRSFIQPKIELGAVLNTVCKKCGTKGHLAKDCFKTPGSKAYELLPEDDDFLPLGTSETAESATHKKKKKKKEKKKKKKSKKRRKISESSESSDTESDSSPDRHPHKHRRTSQGSVAKSKRHQRRRSSGDDSSASGSSGEARRRKHPHVAHGRTSGGRGESPRKAASASDGHGKHRRRHSPEGRSSSDEHPHEHGHRHGSRGNRDRQDRPRPRHR